MSSSRKKFSCDQIPLLSVTQKLRQNLNKTQNKRRCCDKENFNQSKERKQSKCKQGNSSSKKLKKKRYLEQQVQKLLQKRCLNEQTKMNDITEKNAFEFEGLRVDLKEMKDALNKFSLEEKRNLKQNTLFQEMENKDQFQIICGRYKRKIDDLRAQLELQKETNAKLQQAYVQSQLVAQQSKDYCQSISKQLADLGQKHLKCDQNSKKLNEKREEITLIKEQKIELQLKVKTFQTQKQSLSQLLQAKTREQSKLKQKIQQIAEECKQIKERQQLLRNENKEIKQQKHSLENQKAEMVEQVQLMKVKTQQKQKECRDYEKKYNDLVQQKMRQERRFNELNIINMSQISKISTIQQENAFNLNQVKILQQNLARQKQKVVQLTAKNELLSQLKSKIQYELKRLQTDFNSTKLDLGNTKQKLGGLSSMQKKCEELYMEIKLQKQRCGSVNFQTIKERQHLQNRLRELENELDSYISRAQKAQSQNQKLKSALQEAKSECKLLLEEKAKIVEQIGELQEGFQNLQTIKLQITKQNEVFRNEIMLLKDEFNQKQRHWEHQLQKYERQHQKLQKQKSQTEFQVKEALFVMKKKNSQLQALNSTYQSEINKLNQQKLTAISQLKIAEEGLKNTTIENEKAKSAISYKGNLIYQLQSQLNQAQNEIFKLKDQAAEWQYTYKKTNTQWQKRCYDIKISLQQLQIQTDNSKSKYQQQHQLWKENCFELEKELEIRDEKLLSLSQIKQNLEQKLNEIEYKLEENQTIRLSLSSELLQHHQKTRRNEQVLQEEKNHLEKELMLKNKTINQLKQTVKIVRDQSMQMREEVLGYNKAIELQEVFASQVYKIQQTLDYLIREKEQLCLSISILKSQNNELSNKVFTIQTQGLQWPEKEARYKETITHLEKQLQTFSKQRDSVISELQNEQNQVKMLLYQVQTQKSSISKRLVQSETAINSTKLVLDQSSKKCQQLNEIIKQKDTIIKGQLQRLSLFQEKRIKVINQVHSIHNQISQIALKNTQMEQQKGELQNLVSRKQQQIALLSEKISILLQNNSALEEQKIALNEQTTLLRKQIKQVNQKLRLSQQNNQKTVNEIYEICEARKNEATNGLKQKIKQLAAQLNNCANRMNNKSREIEQNQQRIAKIQGSLQQTYEHLNQQRKQREKLIATNNQLLTQIDNYKMHLSSKEKQSQLLQRDKTIFREKLVQQQSKYEILRRKYQNLEHQKYNVQKEMENQNISLRVLKEENKNIEKVMAEQLSQRKGIIQQLMTQKRMLYAQLNQQR